MPPGLKTSRRLRTGFSKLRGLAAGALAAANPKDSELSLPARSRVEDSDVEGLVALIYRATLRRDPDAPGLAHHAQALRRGRDVRWLIELFVRSDEFRRLGERMETAATYPLDSGSPMAMDGSWEGAELRGLWDHLAEVWDRYGRTEPYWSVLTQDRFLAGGMDDRGLRAFHETGVGEVVRFNAWLHRNGVSAGRDLVCAEYGCGVGRVTRALAKQFKQVIAFDISESHLSAARRQLKAEGIDNVEFVHVRNPSDLSRLNGIDVFYSVIVLQHNPPPIILDILQHVFEGLNEKGIAFFQVPTYAKDYSFSLKSYEAAMANIRDMEVHFLPQHVILNAAYKQKFSVLEIQPDWCVGHHGRWISNTFLLRKQTA